MKLFVSYHGGTRFDIVSGKHRIVTDQPEEDGGQDAGMSPVELFVGSIASCVAYFVGRFCSRHNISQDGLTVEAEWTTAEAPHRVGAVSIAIRLPHRLTHDQKERLLKVAHGCTVHQSITGPVRVDLRLNPHDHS